MRRCFRLLAAALCWSVGFGGGCRTPGIDPFLVLQVPADQKLYTAYNLWYESETISSVNYQFGKVIPFGTEIRLERVTEEEIVFVVAQTGRRFTLRYHQKYCVEPMASFLKRLVTTEDAAAQSRDLPEELARKMRAGMVVPGMTKAQVIKTFGYPPVHRTPSLESDSWIYWRHHGATLRVFFKDGKVLELH